MGASGIQAGDGVVIIGAGATALTLPLSEPSRSAAGSHHGSRSSHGGTDTADGTVAFGPVATARLGGTVWRNRT